MKRLKLFFVFVLVTFCLNGWAQDPCPPDDCADNLQSVGTQVFDLGPSCNVTVELFVGECNGEYVYEYNILDRTPTFGCFLYDNKSLTNQIAVAAAQNIRGKEPGDPDQGVPECDGDGGPPFQKIATFNTKSCTYFNKCEIQATIDPNGTYECEAGNTCGDCQPRPGETFTYTVTNALDCGTSCCKTTHKVCTKTIELEDGTTETINQTWDRNTVQVKDCTGGVINDPQYPDAQPSDCAACR